MKVVVITGSPWSNLNQVKVTFKSAGLFPPVPTDNNELSIDALHEQMQKADPVGDQGYMSQQALNIIQANQGQEMWGWTNPESTWLLDFWNNIERNIYFVLVYSPPEEDVARFMLGAQETERSSETAATLWFSYNTQLLRFYNRNRERCILVGNADHANSSELLTRCNERFGLSLQTGISTITTEEQKQDYVGIALARSFLKDRNEIYSLYNEMQATATLPADVDAPVLIDTAWSMYLQLQNKSKGLEQENELLALQLHQVQEELEHYFLLHQEGQQKQVSPPSDGRVYLEISGLSLGSNWYEDEEVDGINLRWSGPEPRATISLPIKREQKQLLAIQYKQVLTPKQLKGLRIEINGEPVSHKVYDKTTPNFLVMELEPITEKVTSEIELAIVLPDTVKPSDIDSNSLDERSLGIAVCGISLLPLKPRLHLSWPETIYRHLRLKFYINKIGKVDSFPLAYFDGKAYLEKYPDVAESVHQGLIASAFMHYIHHGHYHGHRFMLADSNLPSEGNEHDLMQLPDQVPMGENC